MDKRKIILIFAFSIIEFSCALPKNDVHLDFCDFEKSNYDYISDLVSFKIQTVQCENDEIKSFTTPEKPDGYNLNKFWHLKQINETEIIDVSASWYPPHNAEIEWLTGFMIILDESKLFVCFNHTLNYLKHAKNISLKFQLNCTAKHFNKVFQPGDRFNIKIFSLNGKMKSKPLIFNVDIPKCQKNKLLSKKSFCKLNESAKKPLFLIPLFVGLLILLLPLIFLYRRRHFNVITLKKSIKFNQINISEKDKTILPLTITPKHVLVHVADEDHDLFISVAMNLLHFLQNDVGIPIIAQQFDENADIGYTQWMENAVKQADKVVVIWSPLSKQRWIKENSFDKFLPLIRHLKTQMILDPKSTQLAFVCFKCLGVEDSIPKELMDICPNFTLMQNLENLYFWLTGIEMYGPGQERCIDKVKYENFQSQPHGCNLKKAIDELEKDKDQVLAWYDDQISTDESSSSSSSESCDLSDDHKTFCYSVEGSDKDNRNIEYVQTKSYQNDNEFVESFCVSVESDSSNKSCSGSLMCQHCTSKLADCKYDQDILRVSTETLNCLHVAYDSEDNLDTHLSFFNFDDD